jgi:hypothetical protein
MKKLVFILFFITYNFYAQTANYSDIKFKANFKEYISKSGRSIKVNDTIQIGLPSAGNNFVFITQGNVGVMASLAKTKAIITNIKSIGTDKTGYKIYLLFKGYGLLPLYIDYENAIETGEL